MSDPWAIGRGFTAPVFVVDDMAWRRRLTTRERKRERRSLRQLANNAEHYSLETARKWRKRARNG